MALIATTPPFLRLARAATTTSPLGAKVTARSSATGGLSFSFPTQVAPREAAKLRWDAPRVETYTSHFQALSTAIARCAEAPNPNNPTRLPCSTPATRRLRKPMMPAHKRGAACRSSRVVGSGNRNQVGPMHYWHYRHRTEYQ